MSMSQSKPKSMPTGQRNVVRPNDSHSLWNYTISPCWSRDECDIFRKALMKFGIGNWRDILESGSLPGKTNAQLNLQLQRFLGQQSTAEFQGLHIDPLIIGELNSKKQGINIKRKNGQIVNTGGKLTREELKKRINENKENFGLPESEWSKIEIPRMDDPILVLKYKNKVLQELKQQLIDVQRMIANARSEISATQYADNIH